VSPLWTVIQAEAHGVTGTRPDGTGYEPRTLDRVAPGGQLTILRPPSQVDPNRTLAFARSRVGNKYGYLTIVSVCVDELTPAWFHVPFRRPGTWICSALGSEALRYGGWLWDWPDIYAVDPAESKRALEASGAKEIDLAGAEPGDVGFAHSEDTVAKAIRLVQRIHGDPDWEINHMFILDRLIHGE